MLRYFYSTDATELVEPLIERYNTESHRFGGRDVQIDGKGVRSGEAEAALAAGDDERSSGRLPPRSGERCSTTTSQRSGYQPGSPSRSCTRRR